MIGIGNKSASFCVYIENKPPLERYQALTTLSPINAGEIKNIADETGNHWRKIFNVYAKLYFEYTPLHFKNWQALRDNHLLQEVSNTALVFTPPTFAELNTKQPIDDICVNKKVNLIMGRTYAKKLGVSEHCYWLSEDFAINHQASFIICPYFDYRQLSNIKIIQLTGLINSLTPE